MGEVNDPVTPIIPSTGDKTPDSTEVKNNPPVFPSPVAGAETKPSVSTPAPTPPVVVSKPADPKGTLPNPAKDNLAQGLDTEKHNAISNLLGPKGEEHPHEDLTSADVLKKIQVILAEYDHKESDIPTTHAYWNLLNQYRRLRSQENA